MTKLFCVLCDILFCVMLLVSTASAQVQWTKYASNPVITPGPASWDIIAIGQPTALLENDTIKMWYAGVGTDMKARICYAWSLDGFNWIKHANPVMDVGAAGSWDSGWLDTPEIVRDNTGYKLYYYGDTAQQNAAISSAIGLAYSPDGINWTREASNPVFIKGTFGDWDGTWVESPTIVWDSISGLYSMWYNGVDTATWKVLIGLATSSDGVSWTRYAGNPVLNTGAWGSCDDIWLGTPALLRLRAPHPTTWLCNVLIRSPFVTPPLPTAFHGTKVPRIPFSIPLRHPTIRLWIPADPGAPMWCILRERKPI